MTAGNFIVGWLVLFAVCGLAYWLFFSEHAMRCGLWVNGIEGRQQDEVVEHWKRTRVKR